MSKLGKEGHNGHFKVDLMIMRQNTQLCLSLTNGERKQNVKEKEGRYRTENGDFLE